MNLKLGTVFLYFVAYVNAGKKTSRDASEVGYLYEKPNVDFEIPEAKILDVLHAEEDSGVSVKDETLTEEDLENHNPHRHHLHHNHHHHHSPKQDALEIAKEIVKEVEEKEEEIQKLEKNRKRDLQTGKRGINLDKRGRSLQRRQALPLLGKTETEDRTLKQKPVTTTKQSSRV